MNWKKEAKQEKKIENTYKLREQRVNRREESEGEKQRQDKRQFRQGKEEELRQLRNEQGEKSNPWLVVLPAPVAAHQPSQTHYSSWPAA